MVTTYFLPPTIKFGGRIKARGLHNQNHVLTLPLDPSLDMDGNHKKALFAFITRFLPCENRPFSYTTMPNKKRVWVLVRENNTVRVPLYMEQENVRDPNFPCSEFTKKQNSVIPECDGDGHYLCDECSNKIR